MTDYEKGREDAFNEVREFIQRWPDSKLGAQMRAFLSLRGAGKTGATITDQRCKTCRFWGAQRDDQTLGPCTNPKNQVHRLQDLTIQTSEPIATLDRALCSEWTRKNE